MNQLVALDILQSLIIHALLLAAPILSTAVVVGVIVSLFQSLTSIQEQTLSFVPKLCGSALVFLLCASWMVKTITEFCIQLFALLPEMVA
jgi:flagellar biosynthetic protein FliQ